MRFSEPKSLYLTALLPSDDIAQREHILKKEISEKYRTKVAIKKTAHITIIPPFWADIDHIEKLFPVFESACQKITPFNIRLNEIGNFKSSKTVFIKVEENESIQLLYQKLALSLVPNTWMSLKHFPFKKLTPHMTLAYRDLNSETFNQIWNDYKDLEFKGEFNVTKLDILKMVNGLWTKYSSFKLGDKKF
jgi:2'-5' RNA ligase